MSTIFRLNNDESIEISGELIESPSIPTYLHRSGNLYLNKEIVEALVGLNSTALIDVQGLLNVQRQFDSLEKLLSYLFRIPLDSINVDKFSIRENLAIHTPNIKEGLS